MQQTKRVTVVLDVRPMLRSSQKAVVEAVLGRRPGVERVEANPVSQTATVVFDPAQTSLADLRRWVEECGLHCAGQSVPEHICDPLMEPDPPTATATTKRPPSTCRRHQPSRTITTRRRPPPPAGTAGTLLRLRKHCGPRTR